MHDLGDELISVEEFDEASHGKLKVDYRIATDRKTGHKLKIIYSLDNIQVTSIGEYHRKYNTPDKWDPRVDVEHIQKNIRKLGNMDHESKGQKVLAIVDLVTGERLQEADCGGAYADTEGMKTFHVKVGEVENEPNYKSTFFDIKGDLGSTDEMLLALNKRQYQPIGRGVKYRNINKSQWNVSRSYTVKEALGYLKHDTSTDEDIEDERYVISRHEKLLKRAMENPEKYDADDIATINKKRYVAFKHLHLIKTIVDYKKTHQPPYTREDGVRLANLLNQHRASKQDPRRSLYESVMTEAQSHRLLKVDHRLVLDANTGHPLHIVYSLDGIILTKNNVVGDGIGHFKRDEGAIDENEVKLLKRYGNTDHQSYNQKVLAIIDMETGEKLQTALCKGAMKYNDEVFTVTVGEVEDKEHASYKSTYWSHNNKYNTTDRIGERQGYRIRGIRAAKTDFFYDKFREEYGKDLQYERRKYKKCTKRLADAEANLNNAINSSADADVIKSLETEVSEAKEELRRSKRALDVTTSAYNKFINWKPTKGMNLNESSFPELNDELENLTPEALSEWMRENIIYDNSISDWRLKSPIETLRTMTGNCHDQSLFASYILRSWNIPNWQLFFVEFKEDSEVGGNTHTLTYYRGNDARYYWIENAWEQHAGIHGPYDDIDDLKDAIIEIYDEDDDINSREYDGIVFSSKGNYRVGMTLGEYVKSWELEDDRHFATYQDVTTRYYRAEYDGEGVYEALRKAIPMEDWKTYLSDGTFNWLPKPPEYVEGYRSWFTKEGWDMFLDKVAPLIRKYLDTNRLHVKYADTLEGKIVYQDKYQVVVDTKELIQELTEWIDQFAHDEVFRESVFEEASKGLLQVAHRQATITEGPRKGHKIHIIYDLKGPWEMVQNNTVDNRSKDGYRDEGKGPLGKEGRMQVRRYGNTDFCSKGHMVKAVLDLDVKVEDPKRPGRMIFDKITEPVMCIGPFPMMMSDYSNEPIKIQAGTIDNNPTYKSTSWTPIGDSYNDEVEGHTLRSQGVRRYLDTGLLPSDFQPMLDNIKSINVNKETLHRYEILKRILEEKRNKMKRLESDHGDDFERMVTMYRGEFLSMIDDTIDRITERKMNDVREKILDPKLICSSYYCTTAIRKIEKEIKFLTNRIKSSERDKDKYKDQEEKLRRYRNWSVKESVDLDKFPEVDVKVVESSNPNDPESSKAVDVTFYADNNRIGEASISAIDTPNAFMYNVEVFPEYRGQGYGNSIVAWCLENYNITEVTVEPDNIPAISLYEKFGFTKYSDYEENGKKYIDMRRNSTRDLGDDTITDIATMDDLIKQCDTPEKLYDWMKENIQYGWLDKSGKKNGTGDHDDTHHFFDEYVLQSPDELIKSGIGVCWDQVELARSWFEAKDFDYTVICVESSDGDDCPTHSFILYKYGNLSNVWWFEGAWRAEGGAHSFENLEKCLSTIVDKLMTDWNSNGEVHIYNMTNPPKPGSTCQEYYDIMEASPEIDPSKDTIFKESIDTPELPPNHQGYTMETLPRIMYYASRNKHDLVQNDRVFLTPYIGIASIFIIDNMKAIADAFEKENGKVPTRISCNTGYKEWNMESQDLGKPLKKVHILHNIPTLTQTITGSSTGYIHCIDITDIRDQLKLFTTKDPDREVYYDGGKPLKPVEIIGHSLKWEMNYSPERMKTFGEGIVESTYRENSDPIAAAQQTDSAELNKNGANRKKLYLEFISWAKKQRRKNVFGTIYDKDVFKTMYSFVPQEMRYFYRLANPMLCVLKGNLTFFPVSELSKINKDNKKMKQQLIFAATESDLRVYNKEDKGVYIATEMGGDIQLDRKLANSFDEYIQGLVGKDILSGIE